MADLSDRNDRPCAGCRFSEEWPHVGFLVCAEPAVVEELKGRRHCGEVARHNPSPCGPMGVKFKPKRR